MLGGCQKCFLRTTEYNKCYVLHFSTKWWTSDKSWVLYINAEKKLQSMEWCHNASPIKSKKAWKICQKDYGNHFFFVGGWKEDCLWSSGMWTTIITEVNSETSRKAIENKHRGLPTSGVMFLYDNIILTPLSEQKICCINSNGMFLTPSDYYEEVVWVPELRWRQRCCDRLAEISCSKFLWRAHLLQ